MPAPIVFYDLASAKATPQVRAWSPNAWKTRYSLGFKGLPFKTVWVEYPDIQGLYAKLGATPHDTKEDGSPYYTLPLIHDPSTGRVVADSWKIAEYLDATYPDPARALCPRGTKALQWAFTAAANRAAAAYIEGSMKAPTAVTLAPRSEAFFRATRDVEEFSPEEREAQWVALERGLEDITSCIAKNGEGSTYITGDSPVFVDLYLAGWIVWVRQVESKERWEKILGLEGGVWARFMGGLSRYETFDENEVYEA